MIRPINNNTLTSGIIANFDRTLYDAFNSAVNKGNTQAWKEILSFILTQTSVAIAEKSDFVLETLINLPTFLYTTSIKKEEVANYLVNAVSVYYKSMSLHFKSDSGKSELIDKHPSIFYKFYGGVLSFYHYLIFHQDQQVLSHALNEFNQMKEEEYDYETREQIVNLVSSGTEGQKKEIRDNATRNHIYGITQRRAALGYFSWIVYLYALDKIDRPKFLFLISKIDIHYQYFEDLLEDIIQIRKREAIDYLGFSWWDHTDRESGIVYSPPTVYDWILYGMCFLLLKGEMPSFSIEAIIDDSDYIFLYDSVKSLLEYFKKNIEKWQKPLGIAGVADLTSEERTNQINEDLEERTRRILNVFERLKILHDKYESSLIASQQLDVKLVNEFKQRLFEAWKRQCTIFDLFSHFHNQDVVNNSDGLPYLGSKILLQRFKMMFVENHYQQIYGSADLGSDVGRRTDGAFLAKVFNQYAPELPVYDNIISGLDACIKTLTDNKIIPDLIIIPPEFIYQTNIREVPDFVEYSEASDIGSIGAYRGIPVITFYSKVLSKQVIVTSFKLAFSLDIYEDENFIDRRLHIQIKQLTAAEIDQEFEKNKANWKVDEKGLELTDEQAKIRISTSVNLEIWSRARFNIRDINAMSIFNCIQPVAHTHTAR